MELVILIGLQASGKTSFYQSVLADTHVHVSKDSFRNNRRPQRRQMELVREALSQGHNVAVDNTNINREQRANLVALGHEMRALVIGYYFESRPQECVRRNADRAGRQRVSDVAIYATVARMEHPSRGEGFDELHYVRLRLEGGFEVMEWQEKGEHGS